MMNKKIKIKKYSDNWGNYNCSSNNNLPKIVDWINSNSLDNHEFTFYIDGFIRSAGFDSSEKNKIGWLLETPQINEETIKFLLSDLNRTKEHFKYIFTCIEELVSIGDPFVYSISNAVPWIYQENRFISKKTKLVSMIASNKSWLRGHRKRLEWVDVLKDKVDLFGRGRQFPLINKEDGLRDYMFSVAIENDSSDMYFTEKLTDCFAMGTVPIYYGSRKAVEKYFDPRGVIFLEDDPSLSTISENKYDEMKPYIEKNFELTMKLPIAEDFIYETYLKKNIN